MENHVQTIRAAHEGKKRIDHFLSETYPEYSRAYFQKLIKKGHVRLRGEVCCSSKKVLGGDEVSVDFLDEYVGLEPDPSIHLDIIHEDDDILVLNKPAGLVVHPAIGNPFGTLANALAAHLKDFTESLRPGIVHRLDKNTSGIMVIAKTPEAQSFIGDQFAGHTVKKTYLTIVQGVPKDAEAVIDMPIGRDPNHRQKMAVISGGRKAETYIRVLEFHGSYAFLEVKPRTGRTHQIRVHLAYMGYPVIGDETYGGPPKEPFINGQHIQRQMLHAWKIVFKHPRTRKEQEYTASIPDDFTQAWERVKKCYR